MNKMKCTAEKVIKIAKSQIGYLEKKSNTSLDSATKNAGRNNYTKFARDYKRFAGINLQGQAWCDMFVDWCFTKAFGKKKGKVLLGGFSAYTPTSARYFKQMKRWYDTPQPGDVIFFKNSERICHTGIVTKVSGGKVYTVEGNTSAGKEVIPNGGGVFEKSYVVGNPRIAGYGRPNYDIAYSIPIKTVSKTSSENDIKWLQNNLNKVLKSVSGYIPLTVDGNYGEKTKMAVLLFWRKQGWNKNNSADGTKAGLKTILKLNKLTK
jgi:hypothetical protein